MRNPRRLAWGLVLAWVAAVAADGAEPPAPSAGERKAAWQGAMRAAMEAVARRDAAWRAKPGGGAEVLQGLTFGPWWSIGPFEPSKDPALSDTDIPHPPEREIDLTKTYGGIGWLQRKDLPDFPRRQRLLAQEGPVRGPAYAYRVIRAEAPMTLIVTLTRPPGMAVWLNGRMVFRFEREIPFAGYDHNVRLELTAGENRLLIKLLRPYGFSFMPEPTWKLPSGKGGASPDAENPLNPIWSRLAREFADPASRRQIRWEREDGIWDRPWGADTTAPLADRYAKALARHDARGGAAAGAPADVDQLRALYYRARALREAGSPATAAQRISLKRAIEDLIATFGDRYPRGRDFIARLDALGRSLDELLPKAGQDAATAEAAERAYGQFQQLREAALLANPLMAFDRLLLVKRFCSYRNIVGDNGIEPGQPVSWASHASLPTHGWDNEIAVLSPPRPDGALATLYRPAGTEFVGDVDLHWDADRLLFSSISAGHRWQLFEIGADGKTRRQILREEHPGVHNFDGCYLPNGKIVFNSTAPFQAVPCSPADLVANLYLANADGAGVRRLCFDQDQNYTPAVMNDGRVIYTRWEYADVAHVFARLLFTMNPDGTSQFALYGSNSYWPTSIWFARAAPDHPSKVAAIVSGHHGCRRRGELILFDTAHGRQDAEGAVHRIGASGKPIVPVLLDAYAANTFPTFLHPWPLSDKYLLAACRPAPASPWGIYLVDVFDNLLPLLEDADYALLEPIPFRRAPKPPVIPDRVKPDRKDATVFVADVYLGPGLKDVPRGTIKQLRVYSFVFGYHHMGNYGGTLPVDPRWLLGAVPVDADGSAHFRAPANMPLSVQPLDAQGRAIQTMRSWYTPMPGEQASCVGCHERAGDAASSRKTLAALRAPSEIQPWYGPARPYSFKREVQPVLDRRCVGCHAAGAGGKVAARGGAPALSPSRLRHFVRAVGQESDYRLKPPGEYYAEASELIQMLRKGHHGVTLDREDFDRLITWIDLNTPEHGTWSEKGAVPYNQVERRRQLQRCYAGLDLDTEAFPPVSEPAPSAAALAPPQPARPGVAVAVPGWPLDAAEAVRLQKAAGPAVERRIEVGRDSDGKPIALDLVLLPPGEFLLGDTSGANDENPPTRARIEKPFWMARCEITNSIYRLFDPSHDSHVYDGHPDVHPRGPGAPLDGPQQPVVRVSWERALAFCRWLSARTGLRVTLPTEAQWEYACRAGSAGPLGYGGVDADFSPFANMADKSLRRVAGKWGVPAIDTFDDRAAVTAPVGQYKPNAWGLCDMHGNAAEWTLSRYRPYPYRDDDGRNGESPEEEKVVRGGSFRDRPHRCRSSFRLAYPAWMGVYDVGFRVVADAEGPRATMKRMQKDEY
jgi:formylglycine-generating enzyme required for sulfatase activity